ncbi:MAG: lipopolysaccharide biosynthesis protein [Burkholderiales bacterium]|nr:lipopolysaccharide biosynthesis protein [Burkholderiales bacterium]
MDLAAALAILAARWRLFVVVPLAAGLLAFGAAFLIKPTFTARTVFLPPQQPQSAGNAALSSLSALSGLAGSIGAIKSPADQYVSLMHSANVQDRVIDKYRLMQVYDVDYRFLARKELDKSIRTELGKKDGLITLEVDASSAQLAADMANQFVAELRRLSSELVLTEAQQRRQFFEAQLKQTRVKLGEAQQQLSKSGFDAAALKAEPKAAAEGYARLEAEATAAEVRLQTLRRSLADTAPEVQQQLAQYEALNAQLAKLADAASPAGNADYVNHYRDFKYQEALLDLFAKQYEMARLDESREGGLIQVVDVATPPERKSKPHRAYIAAGVLAATFILLIPFVLLTHYRRQRAAAGDRPPPLRDEVVPGSAAV